MVEDPPKESEKQIESVDKALIILECFSDGEPELTLKQISQKTGLYKSRILRLCGTLAAHGFLIRLPGSVYRLGPRLMMLGKVYERSNTLISLARPVLRELASLTGESTKLFVIEGRRRLCLVREKGTYPLQYAVDEGESLELYAGAGGKLLMAYASDTLRQEVLSRTLTRLTPSTIVERDRLEQEFEAIRKQGYASSRGEIVPEVAGMSAPVFDNEHSVVAALTVAGPIQRFSDDRRDEILDQLLSSASRLSQLLGHPN